MLHKIVSVIICCFFFVRVSAQSSTGIISRLNNITTNIDAFVKDNTVSPSCRDNVKKFRKGFVLPGFVVTEKKRIDSLVSYTNKFITSLHAKEKKCDQNKIKKMTGAAGDLLKELKKIKVAPAAEPIQNQKKDSTEERSHKADSLKKVLADSLSKAKAPADSGSVDVPQQMPPAEEPSAGSAINTIVFVGTLVMSAAILLILMMYSRKSRAYKKILKQMEALKSEDLPVEDAVVLSGDKAPVANPPTQPTSEPPMEVAPEEAVVVITPENDTGVPKETITDELSQVAASEPLAAIPITANHVNDSSYFICEVMMTAGPRKKFMGEEDADKDLGEDVCGFISNTNEVLIWLLDGTSDLHCLKNPITKREYFSSRLLALGIAEKLKKIFMQKPVKSMADMVAQAIQEVKDAWVETINILPMEEQLILKSNITNKNFPECATTILVAQLSINGDFVAYRSGDSKMLLFNATSENELKFVDTTLERKNDESNDRIFFRVKLNESEKFDIISNDPLNEVIEEKNINTIIAFSDGIGMSTEQLLIEEYKAAPADTRSEIIYRSQETGDDKSICFIEIKEPGIL